MNLLKKIARKIEKDLGFTNGWKIDEQEYSAKCHKIASDIVGQLDALVILRPKDIAELKSLIETGSYLANIAFNLKQKDDIPKDDKKLLDLWQKDWDDKRGKCLPLLNKIYGAV